MNLIAVSVFDDAVKSFSAPMFFMTQEQAIRYFEFLASGNDSDIGRFPQSHHLFKVGEFDQFNGIFDSLSSPELLVSGASLS